MREMRNVRKILVEKAEGKKSDGRVRVRLVLKHRVWAL
jgi:hypothetical protein